MRTSEYPLHTLARVMTASLQNMSAEGLYHHHHTSTHKTHTNSHHTYERTSGEASNDRTALNRSNALAQRRTAQDSAEPRARGTEPTHSHSAAPSTMAQAPIERARTAMNQGHMAPNERTRTVPHRAPQHKALTHVARATTRPRIEGARGGRRWSVAHVLKRQTLERCSRVEEADVGALLTC